MNLNHLKHATAALVEPGVPIQKRIRGAFYRAKLYPIFSVNLHRKYRLKIDTLDTSCYHSDDEILLHAAFQCLTQHVEEYRDTIGDPSYFAPGYEPSKEIFFPECPERDRSYVENQTVLAALYQWWTIDRPKRVDPWAEGVDLGQHTPESLEDLFYEEDTTKLCELVKRRESIWF